jgi:hypothetical protein
MILLQGITEIFTGYAPTLKKELDIIRFFSGFCQKETITQSPYFSFYAEKNHPLKKSKFEKKFIKRRSFTRPRKGVKAYMAAHEFMEARSKDPEPINIQDIIHINRLVRELPDDDSEMPVYNPERSFIRDFKPGAILYQGAEPADFAACMDFILKTIRQPSALHPILQAAHVFFMMVLVHPFKDGNGRTSRLLSTYIMKRNGFDLITTAYEEYYIWDKDLLNFIKQPCDFYQLSVGPQHIQAWMRYYVVSISQAYQELFKLKLACKIAEFRGIFFKQTTQYTLVSPVPANTPLKIEKQHIRRYGPIGGQWAYRDIEGNIIAWNVRFNGYPRKNIPKCYYFFQWFSNNTWQRTGMQFEDMLPIYGLHKIRASKGKTVLIFEGEKCADAAETLLPENQFITLSRAAASGLGSVGQTDWQPLINAGVSDILVWRDNDIVGKQTEVELCKLLHRAGCKTQILSEEALKDKPAKWDIANAVSEGLTTQECIAFLKAHMVAFVPAEKEKSAS